MSKQLKGKSRKFADAYIKNNFGPGNAITEWKAAGYVCAMIEFHNADKGKKQKMLRELEDG